MTLSPEEKRYIDYIKKEDFAPDTRSAIEIIESELDKEIQQKRATALFDRLVNEGRTKEAQKTAWHLHFSFGIDCSID